MPKTLTKPTKKAAAKRKPVKDGPAYERIRQATTPTRRSKKTIAQRMREATGARHKPKRRSRAMTDEQQGNQPKQQAQPRGAGSGEKANATRDRNLVDWPPESRPRDEVVDELTQQAADNEQYNTEMYNAQAQQAENLKGVIGHPQGDPEDADKAREDAREAFLNATDPERKKAALKGEMEARAKRDKAQAAAATGQR